MNTDNMPAICAEAYGFMRQTAKDFGCTRAFEDLQLEFKNTGTATVSATGFLPVFRYNTEGGEIFSDLREATHGNIGSLRIQGKGATETKALVVAFIFNLTQLKKMREALGF